VRTNVIDLNDARPQGHFAPGQLSDPDYVRDLKERAANHYRSILQYLWPNGRFVGQEFEVGDIHGSKGRSLKISCRRDRLGVGCDFAGNVVTGDIIDVFSYATTGNKASGRQFAEVCERLEEFLGAPFKPVPAPQEKAKPARELPPPTAQYTYTDAAGAPIVVVYRYDLPELGSHGKPKKEFRPFIVAEKRFAAPKENRPLYNIPAIAAKPWVVFVEGEKAADALIKAGVDATCAMSGSKAPVEKTDWSPLTGKHVVIWPDADEEGEELAAKVRDHLADIATSVALITIPAGKPKGWDAADAIIEGVDFRAILNSAVQAKPKSALAFELGDWDTLTAYAGDAPEQEWLISDAIPRRCAALLAAAGDTGKSFLALDLCLRVTGKPTTGIDLNQPIFGGQVQCHGAAVFITAEDGKGSVHRRLKALDPDGSRQKNRAHPLYLVALPDAGGPFAIVVDEHGRAVHTPQLVELRERLKAIPDLALVVLDPLQCYVLADTNSDPQAAAYTMSLLNMIAAETNSTVLVTHHVRKEREAPKNAQEARHLIRGSSALVDQSRAAIVLWTPDEPDARKICKTLDVPFTPNAVVHGAVVKSNDGANREKWTLIRGANGILRDVSGDIRRQAARPSELMGDVVNAVARAANEGRPMTCTGVNGLHARRAELGDALADLGRQRLQAMADDLVQSGQLVLALANGTTVKWLDVPNGPFAMGCGEFAAGASTAKVGRKAFNDGR
jgi:hypothetical protein